MLVLTLEKHPHVVVQLGVVIYSMLSQQLAHLHGLISQALLLVTNSQVGSCLDEAHADARSLLRIFQMIKLFIISFLVVLRSFGVLSLSVQQHADVEVGFSELAAKVGSQVLQLRFQDFIFLHALFEEFDCQLLLICLHEQRAEVEVGFDIMRVKLKRSAVKLQNINHLAASSSSPATCKLLHRYLVGLMVKHRCHFSRP